MSTEYNFQTELETSIKNADQKLDKKELLEDIFKIYVAKVFELVLSKSKTKDRLPSDAVVEAKKNLISEFRKASLENWQMSVEQYEDLFEKTVQEIINDIGNAHKGDDIIATQSNLEINKSAYQDLYQKTPSGLYVPN